MTKVLIIDDADDLLYVARYILGEIGDMEVHTATNAEEGVQIAVAERPDCILLDLVMPGIDGEETLELLRRAPETRDIPVIFLTSRVRTDDVARRNADQIVGVITKPFDAKTFASQIREMLGRK